MIRRHNRITVQEVFKIFAAVLIMNIVFAAILYPWVTEDDIQNLPKEPLDRFLTLFFFGFTSFTTIGFGEYGSIQVKSLRVKMIVTLYILLAISGAASFFFNF